MIEIRLSFMKYVELDKLKMSFLFFLMTIFKDFIELVIILLLFMCFCFVFGHEAYGILAPQPRKLRSAPLASKSNILTTGSLGKSPKLPFSKH